MREIAREHPSDFARGTSVLVEPMRDHLVGPIETALWILLAAVGLVLLIACANIANLLLARTSARTREIAIRTALGCGRWRMAGQLLTESLLLSVIGGGAGVLLAWQGISVLASLAPKELPRLDEVRMDPAVLLFGLGISLATGLLFGIVSRVACVAGGISVGAAPAKRFAQSAGDRRSGVGLRARRWDRPAGEKLPALDGGGCRIRFAPHPDAHVGAHAHRPLRHTGGHAPLLPRRRRQGPRRARRSQRRHDQQCSSEPHRADEASRGRRSEPQRFRGAQRRCLLDVAGLLSRAQDPTEARPILHRARRRRRSARGDGQRAASSIPVP